MMTNTSITATGDGTRPTTDGGVDNIGAGEKFTSERTAAGGEVSKPGPREAMSEKRKDVEASRHDDSDAFHLHEDLSPEANTEAPPEPQPGP